MMDGVWPHQQRDLCFSSIDEIELDLFSWLVIQFAPMHFLCSFKMRSSSLISFVITIFDLYFVTENGGKMGPMEHTEDKGSEDKGSDVIVKLMLLVLYHLPEDGGCQ